MAQYIDKEALINEIEKRWRSLANKNVKANGKYDIEIYTLLSIKTFIETLEVKEDIDHYELEEFAKIVRGNLTGINKNVQTLFETKYQQLTGNKMYGGYKD